MKDPRFAVWLEHAEAKATIRVQTMRGHLMSVQENTGTCKIKLGGRHLMADITQIDGVWNGEAWVRPEPWPLRSGPGTQAPQRTGKRWLRDGGNQAHRSTPPPPPPSTSASSS